MEIITPEERTRAEHLESQILAAKIEAAKSDTQKLTEKIKSKDKPLDPNNLSEDQFNAGWELLGRSDPSEVVLVDDKTGDPMKMSKVKFENFWRNLGKERSDGHPVAKLMDPSRSKPMSGWIDSMSDRLKGKK